MTWNHRVIRRTYEGTDYQEIRYEIHEVFYNDDGSIYAYTEESIEPSGETLKELKQDLKWMKKALEKPVLEYGKITKDELEGMVNV